MPAERIRKDLEFFKSSLKKLNTSISGASSLWKDEKYSELSSVISQIALDSKDFLVSGERCCSSIDRFQKVAQEKY